MHISYIKKVYNEKFNMFNIIKYNNLRLLDK
jgi:hypothetical protein